jgi:hypothetical protein
MVDRQSAPPVRLAIVALGMLLAVASIAFLRLSPPSIESTDRLVALVYSFREVKWFALAAVGGVWGAMFFLGLIRLRPKLTFGFLDGALVLLALLAFVSIAWTPDVGAAALEGFHILVLISFALLARLVDRNDLTMLVAVLSASGVILFLVMSPLDDGGVVHNGFGNENFGSEFMVLMTGLAFAGAACEIRWLRMLAITASGVGLTYLVVLAPSNLQFLAIAAGAAYVLMSYIPRRYRVAVGLALGVVGALLVALALIYVDPESLPRTSLDRLQGWVNTALLISDFPLLGVGLGGYFYEMAGYIDAYSSVLPTLGEPAYSNYERLPRAAENDALHVTAVLGVAGLVLVAIALIAAFVTSLLSDFRDRRWFWMTLWSLVGASLVSFPLQNPATGVGFAFLLGATVHPDGVGIPLTTGRAKALTTMIVAVLAVLCVPFFQETRASVSLSTAVAMNQLGRTAEAADHVRQAIGASDLSPRLRIQLFPRVIVAGPSYWRDNLTADDVDRYYRVSASAAPSAPLLLDLRARYLLGRPLTDESTIEIGRLIAELKRQIGRTSPAPHILEAALALQNSDLDTATRALGQAEPLLPDPVSDASGHVANYTALRNAVDRARAD